MRISFLILSLILFVTKIEVSAQQMYFSKAQEFRSGKDFFEIGGWVENQLMIFYTSKGKSYMDLYDSAMNRKAIVTLNFIPESAKKVELLHSKNGVKLLYSVQLNSKESFFIASLDKDAKLIGRPKNIENVKQNYFGNTKLSYSTLHSFNNKSFGVFGYRIKDNNFEYELLVLNDSLDYIVSTQNKVPVKNYLDISQMILKDDGRLVCLLTDVSSNKNNEVAEAMIYEISPTTKKNVETKAFPIDFGDVFVENLFLKEDFEQGNKVHFAGLNKNKKGVINGVFIGVVALSAPSNEKIMGTLTPFADSIIQMISSFNLNNTIVKDVIVKNDGGLLILTESMAKLSRSSYSNSNNFGWGYYGGISSSNRYTEYLYKDAILFDLDSQRNLNWISVVDKLQRTLDDNGIYSSFGLLNSGSFLSFVFNEFQNKGIKVKNTIVLGDGRQEERTINSQAKIDGKWLPRFGEQTGLYELMIPIVGSKKLQFVKLNY
ncbi:MAG TPA: hypothetical protein VLZ83_02345 [Edaphocola sp.]|nr:hypothetical protein [Edaphocola sp.]